MSFVKTILAIILGTILISILVDKVFIINISWNQIPEIITIIVGTITTFSILHGITTYNEDEKRRKGNENIILENTKNEITLNIEIIEYIKDRVKYRSKNLFAERFNYYFLEKSLKIISDLNTRTLIMNSISNMKTMNSFLDTYENSLLNSKILAKESFITLKERNNLIKTNLEIIKNHF